MREDKLLEVCLLFVCMVLVLAIVQYFYKPNFVQPTDGSPVMFGTTDIYVK